MDTALATALRAAPLTGRLEDDDLERIAAAGRVLSCTPGTCLFREGEPQRFWGLLLRGRIELRRGPAESPRTVAILVPGDTFGEEALLDDRPYAASALVTEAGQLFELPAGGLAALGRDHPDLVADLTARAGRIAADRPRPPLSAAATHAAPAGSRPVRTEHDLLGTREVPAERYYGIQTLRAVENFPITGIPVSQYPLLVRALAAVKEASALANRQLGLLSGEVADAIARACRELRAGHLHREFVVDVIQGGAGTSTNMNANEVIANRALELLGRPRGDYVVVHPNNHVNLSQSTNDVYPTAVRIASLWALDDLALAMAGLRDAFLAKGHEFADIVKLGRTQLQDAVPMTLGQEFRAYGVTIDEDIARLRDVRALLAEINMGATAIGTGINSDPRYPPLVRERLSAITSLELVTSPDLVEATQDTGVFVSVSGLLKRIAVKLSKICSDLRLLSSGPRSGLNEINLPAMQPGSSIMPGKVNPVIPEVVNQVCFQVIGNDLTVTLAAEAGQLQLNVFEPVMAFNLFQSVDMLVRAVNVLRERCVVGITANRERMRALLEQSVGIVTALVPHIGYERSSAVAREALQSGLGVYQLVLEKGWLTRAELDDILSPAAMTRPRPMPVLRGKQDDEAPLS